MQQFRTPSETIAHNLAIGDGDRGQFYESHGFYFVGQTADDMSDYLLNGDLPCITERSSDRFDGVAPFVLITLIKVEAFVSKLVR
jgi:hypothetical protein